MLPLFLFFDWLNMESSFLYKDQVTGFAVKGRNYFKVSCGVRFG